MSKIVLDPKQKEYADVYVPENGNEKHIVQISGESALFTSAEGFVKVEWDGENFKVHVRRYKDGVKTEAEKTLTLRNIKGLK